MALIHALLIGIVGSGGIPVDVKPLSGPAQRGELVGIEGQTVTLLRDGQPQDLPMLSLWEIRPVAPGPPPANLVALVVELIDGSQLQASSYTVADGLATIRLANGQDIQLRTRSVRFVRFRDHAAQSAVARQWDELTKDKHSGDVIVIRREESLDHLEGMLHDVSEQTAKFEFDGDRIDVNRQRLDGLIYYHPIARQLPERICQVTDVSGSRWHARGLALVEDRIELTTPAGVKIALPAEQLRTLDFSSGNTVWLSDLEPEYVQRRPFVASRLPQPSLERLFQPRRDIGMTGKPLMLDGVTYGKGLALTSRTEIVFRLSDDYRYLHALVGIDDHVREGGNVDLVISGDDRVLFSRTITGREPALPIDLEISGVRRLKILVDFGGEMDIADHLNLADARITK